jgi:molybdate transport system ATP-binding protein
VSPWCEAALEHRLGEFHLRVELALDREIGVLFGPSGAGKTLTLRILAGLVSPRRGTIRLGGRELLRTPGGVNLPAHGRRIGLVHQHLALFPHLTVLENVAYGLHGPNREGRAREWLERVRLEGLDERYPAQLSGGQQQRVALARALAPSPKLLLLDEPFSALDSPLRRSLRRELKALQRDTGVPVFYVTHHVEDLCALGQKVFFIREGHLAGSATPEQLWAPRSPAGAWAALGWGTVISGVIEHRGGISRLRWPDGALQLDSPAADEGPATAFVAPQAVKILYPSIPVDPDLAINVMEGTVVERYQVGASCTLHVAACELNWHVEFPGHSYRDLELREGASVRISVLPRYVEVARAADSGEALR